MLNRTFIHNNPSIIPLTYCFCSGLSWRNYIRERSGFLLFSELSRIVIIVDNLKFRSGFMHTLIFGTFNNVIKNTTVASFFYFPLQGKFKVIIYFVSNDDAVFTFCEKNNVFYSSSSICIN